jgi:hypothetical protein
MRVEAHECWIDHHHVQQFADAVADLTGVPGRGVSLDHIGELSLDGEHGIQRAHAALEDRRDITPPNIPERPIIQRRDIPAGKANPTPGYTRRWVEQPEHRVAQRGLATP